jgi:PIN domain nuclease of toxin-antitoxin system
LIILTRILNNSNYKKKDGTLLNTHTWIWLFSGSKEVSQTTIDEINKWGRQGKVFISAISVWELSMLVAKQRVILPNPINQWVENSCKQSGVSLVNLSPEIAIESSFVSGNFHGDFTDRILIATARINKLILFTRDKKN